MGYNCDSTKLLTKEARYNTYFFTGVHMIPNVILFSSMTFALANNAVKTIILFDYIDIIFASDI